MMNFVASECVGKLLICVTAQLQHPEKKYE